VTTGKSLRRQEKAARREERALRLAFLTRSFTTLPNEITPELMAWMHQRRGKSVAFRMIMRAMEKAKREPK
jgi:hypothetical protein